MRQIAVAFIAMCLLIGTEAQALDRHMRNVLVLHSYHQGYGWTDNITEGIRAVFAKSDIEIKLYTEYMDTKRNSPGRIFPYLEELYRLKYHDTKFDIIIVSDNDALDFILARRHMLFPRVPIVFCGINNFEDSLIAGQQQVTGIVEDFDLRSTLELILRLHPKTQRIAVITDIVPAGKLHLAEFRRIAPDFQQAVTFIELAELTAPELREALHRLADDTVILHLSYHRDPTGKTFTVRESMSLVSERGLPIYSCWDQYMGAGVMGGVITSGETHGKHVGQIALRILHGESIESIPIVRQSPNVPMVDYQQMKRFGTSFSSLPEGTIVINEPQSFYYRYRTTFWIIFAFLALQSVAIFSLVVNTARRKRAEETLRQSEERFRQFFEHEPAYCYMVSPDGNLLDVNLSALNALGYTKEDLVGKPLTTIYAPEVLPKMERLLEQWKNVGRLRDEEMVIQTKNGDRRWVLLNVATVYDSRGQIVHSVSMQTDTTDRMVAEKALRESEERYRTIFESAVEGLFQSTPEGRFLTVNPAFARMCGYDSPEEMVREVTDIARETYINPDERKLSRSLIENHEFVKDFQTQFRRKGGGVIWVSITARAVRDEAGKVVRYEGIVADINERKRAEDALRESEEKYRALVETTGTGYVILDAAGRVLDANREYVRLTGHGALEEILGRKVTEWTAPHDLAQNAEAVDKCVQHGFVNNLEIDYIDSERKCTPIEINATVLRTSAGVRIVTLCRDITERKRGEEALRESEERFRSIVEHSHAGIFQIDSSYRFTYVNDRFCQIVGAAQQELLGLDFRNLLDNEGLKIVADYYVRRQRGEAVPSRYEFPFVRRDGERRVGEMSAVAIKDSAGNIWSIGQILDITERKRTEEERHKLEAQLRHAQKMEAIGTLAGGVAHDFNNLLQVILGYAELMLLNRKNSDPEYDELREVVCAAARGSELVRQLLTFSRKVESKLRPLSLTHEVRQISELLSRTIPKMIEIELHLAEDLYAVNADPAQIEQILMNLAVNAKDAMPEGGKLVIRTENVYLDKDYCDAHVGAKPGHYALLVISDTGHGMDQHTLAHVFEPFFTTKGVGRGTGLGLAMVYGIVKNHDGCITCYSEVGCGTTFRIYLPVIGHLPETARRSVEQAVAGGSETVLLVDDEESVREVARQMLERFGYRVLLASDGETAVAEYVKRIGHVDLVILDLVMPGMGGKRCLEELLWVDPRARVLIASGHAAKDQTKGALEAGAKGFVAKPYELTKLLRAVRDVLGRG